MQALPVVDLLYGRCDVVWGRPKMCGHCLQNHSTGFLQEALLAPLLETFLTSGA